LSLSKAVADQLLSEINRKLKHRHDSREGCRSINTDMQIVSRVRVLPPFKIASRVMVRNLNAQFLQGKTVAQIIAEAQAASGVSSLGEYGDPTVLTGAVKLEEGAEITLTRSDAHNALLIAGSEHNAVKIKGKPVDDSGIGDGKILVYRATGDKLQYETPAGGGAAAGWENVVCYPWGGTAVLSADPFLSYTDEVSENAGVYAEVAWFDFDMPAGTIKSIFAHLVWAQKVTGSGNGLVKWQIASGPHAAPGTWVDITDEVSESSTSYVDKGRSGIAHRITGLTLTTPFTIHCLVKKGTATSAQAKVKSNTYLRVTHKVS